MGKILWILLVWADISGPRSPEEPRVPSPEVTDVVWPEEALKLRDVPAGAPPEMHLFRVELALYGVSDRRTGLWKVSWFPQVVLTNTNAGQLREISFSLYDVSRIDVLTWRVNTVSNTWYQFAPHTIRCILFDGRTNEGFGSLSWLWSLSLEDDRQTPWVGYTIFYDSWEKGTGDRFRWRHALFPHFMYHFTTPVEGTVTSIRFLSP